MMMMMMIQMKKEEEEEEEEEEDIRWALQEAGISLQVFSSKYCASEFLSGLMIILFVQRLKQNASNCFRRRIIILFAKFKAFSSSVKLNLVIVYRATLIVIKTLVSLVWIRPKPTVVNMVQTKYMQMT